MDADATHARVARAFDELAPSYDAEVGGTVGAARAKAVATRLVRDAFAPGDRVLDVGCGTGVDACYLAKRGVEVVALDVSARMLDATRERARRRGVADRVHAVHLPAAAAGELAERFGDASFQGAYSFFGSLNLEPDLDAAGAGLARLLAPGAPFFAGLVNPFVLWELTAYPLILRFDKPFAKIRRTGTMRVSRAREDRVPVRLYTPREFKARFAHAFTCESVRATNVIAPPPYLDAYARRFPRALAWAHRVEDACATRAPWNRLGYFSLLTLRRRAA